MQNIYFYHPDHLGSTSLVTNSYGEITQNISYIPYGEIFVEETAGGWQSPYYFNAKELDEETGLYYYGARYLDPAGARWLSADPMLEKYVGMTPYNYCAGNPVRLVDPDGTTIQFMHFDINPENASTGNYVNGIGEEGMESNWEAFAKTEVGYEILSKFATKGQKIGNVEFTADGEYSKHNLLLCDYSIPSSDAGYNGKFYVDKNNIATFYICISSIRGDSEYYKKERICLTIGHEFFLHFDNYYQNVINAYASGDKTKIGKTNDDWKNNPSGDKEHSAYINRVRKFEKYETYKAQLKNIFKSENINNVIKDHDKKLYNEFGKKKK